MVYSSVYYQLTYRITEELAQLGNRKNKLLARHAAGGSWLLGNSTARYFGVYLFRSNFSVNNYPDSLLVIRRSALPQLHFMPLDLADATRYQLTKVSECFPLHCFVLDAHRLSSEVAAELHRGDFW